MRASVPRLVSCAIVVLTLLHDSAIATAAENQAARPASAASSYVRTLDDDPSGVTFEVAVPLAEVEFDVDAAGRRSVAIDGWMPHPTPGHPELPVFTLSVGIPDGADVTLDYDVYDPAILPGPRLRTVPRYDATTERWEDVPSPEIYVTGRSASAATKSTAALWPAAPVALETVQYRDLRIARIQVWPVRYDPSTQVVEHHGRIRVRLNFDPSAAPKALDRRGGPAVERVARTTLLNGDTILRLRERPLPIAPPAPRAAVKSATSTGPGVRIRVDEPGLFRITAAQLSGIGLDTSAIDPRNLEMSYRGTPIACRVVGEADGVFDAGDAVEFYGVPAETRFAQENVYWLAEATSPGLRFPTLDATPGSARLATDFNHTEHVETGNSIYAFDQGSDEGDPHFFWAVFQEGLTELVNSFVTVKDVVPGDPALLRVSFLGRTNSSDNPDHHVLFRVASQIVGETMWDGRNTHIAEIPFDSNLLSDGANNVKVVYQPISFPDSYYMDWYEVVYPRATTADDDALTIAAGTGRTRYDVSGFGDDDVLILDVTDPHAPIALTGGTASGSGPYSMMFEVDTTDASRFHLASDGGRTAPAAIELDTPSNLRDASNGADLIIVTPEGWESELAPLVAHRESLGLRVVLANLTDVADEFAGGNVDDVAIRDFVKHAYENWQAPAVSFLLLVGEPSLDPRNWIGTAGPVNAMPTHFTVTNALGDTMSDTWFGAVAGADLLPDVAVGRYSVATASAANDQVVKTIDYETFGWDGSAWTRRIMLVASNEVQFEDTLNDALVNVPPDIDIVREFRRSGATTSSIVQSFTDSALIASYLGHGNVTLWADLPGGTYLRSSDVLNIMNGRFFPFITVMNCLNGLVGDPVNRTSLAEAFHANTFNSALAVWAPTTLGFLSEYRRLQEALYETIFVHRASEFGSITAESLTRSYLNSPVSIDTVKGMLLLGDPAGNIIFTCNTTNFDLWCNGIDDDCDGSFDEDYVAEPTSCGTGPCVNSGGTICNGGVITSDCEPLPPPSPDDTTCDSVDDDCDGQRDDDFVHQPTSCGVGACESVGSTYCFFGNVLDNCVPGKGAANDPVCDGIDDDCDGVADEDYAPVSTECGLGPCSAVGETFCSAGVVDDDCVPGPPLAADDATCDAVDDDCDGVNDDDYGPLPTECGVGACANTGTTQCVDGVTLDTCEPGEGAETDSSCDGIDSDCDGIDDEDYAGESTECGVGACAASGQTSCVAGAVEDDCVPGPPLAADDVECDSIDADCDGSVDEDYVPTETSCGVGACMARGLTSCSDGQVLDSCQPGDPGTETCHDAVDNDCDGETDESDAVDATIFYPDADGDGFGDATGAAPACVAPAGWVANADDCNDAASTAWDTPGEVVDLHVAPDDKDRWLWSAPAAPGGIPGYRVMRSSAAGDFLGTNCVSGPTTIPDTTFVDGSRPGAGFVRFYLVRAENECPAGIGPLGTNSNGAERLGSCS